MKGLPYNKNVRISERGKKFLLKSNRSSNILITKENIIKLIHAALNNSRDFVMDNEGFVDEFIKIK